MKRLAVVTLLLLLAGCPEEKEGPGVATPIPRTGPPQRPPPPVAVRVPAPAPPPVEEAPKGPAGLTRSKVGDQVEFGWSRLNAATVDQGSAMAVIATNKGRPPNPEELKKLVKASVTTGTVAITRVLPESPFTFRLEITQGKTKEQAVYAYAKDIPLEKVLYRTDSSDPRKAQKAAGKSWDCVQTPSRLIAPDAVALALAGGLVSERSPELSAGSVSVALTKVGTSKPVAAKDEVKVLDTFETPIAIAMTKVQRFGLVDSDAKAGADDKVKAQIQKAVAPCVKKGSTLDVVISGGKLESLLFNKARPPKPLDQCVRGKLKKLKLPTDDTLIAVEF